MTRTTTLTARPPGPAPAGLDIALPAVPGPDTDVSGRRPRTQFPDPARRPSSSEGEGRSTARWRGPDGPLRELVRDHATAVGLDLIDGPADASTVCTVIDAATLTEERPSDAERTPRLLVTGSAEIPTEVWSAALALGARAVIPLPGGSEELLSHLAEQARPRSSGLLLGVVGGCGGAGASSFAARLAAAARPRGPITLIDADPLGGGVDLLVEAPATDGVGWQEAAELGPDDGEALLGGLPEVDGVHLLVAGDGPGPTERALPPVLSALAALGGTVVVDLSTAMVPVAAPQLDRLLVVTPSTDHAVRAAARRLRAWQLPDGLAHAVVRRGGPLGLGEVGEDLGLPLAGGFRDSSRGTVPLLDVRRRGADRAARELLARLRTGAGS